MKNFNKINILFALAIGVVLYGFNQTGNDPKITSGEVMEHIKYLSSDELAGRFPGTDGDKKTRDYIVKEIEQYGLKPAGSDGYLQPFDFTSEVKLGKNNKLALTTGELTGKAGVDYNPVYLSTNGTASGDLVFVGYGINAPDLNYNDYAGVNLKGKIALMLLHSPGYNDPHNNPFGKYERLRIKCAAAKEQGAIGVMVIKGPESGEDELLKLRMLGPGESAGIPVMNLKRDLIDYVFKMNSKRETLQHIQKLIDSTRIPRSFEYKGGMVEFTTDLVYVKAETANVIGMLEGNDPALKNEAIVIGAHLDHLGDGLKYGSLFESHVAEIHNGADDNASGTAGVLELAEYFASMKKDLKRNIIFMWYSGEEAGLIGSGYYVKSDLFNKYKIVTMINLDMVGRLTDNKLTIGGTGTSSIWVPLLDSLNKSYGFTAAYNKDGFGPSDHSSFYGKDVPVLFFFTGLHKQYHRPEDDWELINSDGEAKILDMVASIVNYVDNSSGVDFIKVQEEKKETNMGFRVTLGVIPDYSSTREGLELTGVKSGGVAEKAGLQAGDVIIKLGQYEIKNIYDYTDALSKFKPGEETVVVFMRGTEQKTVNVTFGK